MNDQPNSNNRWPGSLLPDIVSIFAAAAVMIYCNGGIGVGASNHVGLLPVVRRMLDPNYLPGDFNIALRFYHHRAFAYLVAGGSALLGEDRALILLAVLAMVAVSAALFGLCSALGLSRWGFLAVAAFVATRFAWTGRGLELNEFLGDPEVMPPLLAHALVLFVMTALLKERYRLAVFLTGLAILLHLQIGLTLALMTSPLYFIKLREFGWKEVSLLAVLLILPASPTLWHVGRMLERGLAKSSVSSAFYIDFRHPHHFELLSLMAALWVAAHLAMVVLAYWFFRRRNANVSRAIGKLLVCSAALVALCLIHFADYYFIKNDKLAQVQFLRVSPLITILGAICFVLLVNCWYRMGSLRYLRFTRGLTPVGAGRSRSPFRTLVNLSLIVAAAGWGWYSPRRLETPYYFGVRRNAEEKSSWADVARWVKVNGPRDTVYLAPPGNNGFSVLSERSIVAEFKLNPDGAMFLAEWFERLRDLAGGELPTGHGFENRKLLNKAFAKLDNEQLLSLSQKYNAAYAVLPKDSKAAFDVLYQNKEYRVVRLR
ncbi:MAG: DUF6798 domain-containing protein [Acidobacteriota bacterium]